MDAANFTKSNQGFYPRQTTLARFYVISVITRVTQSATRASRAYHLYHVAVPQFLHRCVILGQNRNLAT